ncbi:hypothetical protein MRX96_000164 [Rhipicephalus microplus]
MLSNPFCFVLQVLAVLQEIRLSQHGCLPGIKQAELLRRYGPEPSPLADYGISSIKSPHTTRWPLRLSSVTSHHVSILEATKGREPASHPSGPGSSTTGGVPKIHVEGGYESRPLDPANVTGNQRNGLLCAQNTSHLGIPIGWRQQQFAFARMPFLLP